MPAKRTWPPPVEIGTKRPSASALRTVQGATTRTTPATRIAAWASERFHSARAPRAKTSSASRKATARYSGRTIAVAPSRRPGTSQRARKGPSPAQKIDRTDAESRVAASGSLISIPWYSSRAG